MRLRSFKLIFISIFASLFVATCYADEREEYHDQYRGAKSLLDQIVKTNARDLQAVMPFGEDGCGKWEVAGICVKANIFREGPIVKILWSYFYTDIVFEANRRPTGSLFIPKFMMTILSAISHPLLTSIGVQTVPKNMQHYAAQAVKNKVPAMQGASQPASEALKEAYNNDLHFGALPHAGLLGNAIQSGSDKVFANFPLFSSIWSPFTMIHKYQYNTKPADKRNPDARQKYLPYIALDPRNVLFHYYEVLSQLNPYYRERAFKIGEPRNCLGTQLLAQQENREKPIERFIEHGAAGHINRQSARDQLTCPGSGYEFWTPVSHKGDTLYAAQLAAITSVVAWDTINSRETLMQEPTKKIIENLDYIQFIKPFAQYKPNEIKGDPSHFLGHVPNPDDIPNPPGPGGWPKGCKDRYVENKTIGPQSHTAAPKLNFNTDFIGASAVIKDKHPANHYVMSGWTNVWGCPYDYINIGGKDGEIEKLQ